VAPRQPPQMSANGALTAPSGYAGSK